LCTQIFALDICAVFRTIAAITPGSPALCSGAWTPLSVTRSLNQQLLAERLNVSRTTISRSLANHPAISAETREKVQKLAAEMGYRGVRTRGSRTRPARHATIGVLIGVPAENVAMATFPFILSGIRERAEIEHLSVDVCFEKPAALDPNSKRQSVFRHIRAGDWRGMILIYPFPEPAVDLIARKISTVAVLESYSGVDIIDTDDSAAILALVTRLKEAGHRRIGFVTWDYPVGGHWSLRRFGGYIEALYYHGIEFRPEWVINIDRNTPHFSEFGPEIPDRVAAALRRDRVTAWVCAADHQAYHLMRELNARGIRVPEDCSITGFDGLEPPPNTRRITSMLVPHEDIGASAVARLFSRMMHPNSPRRKILVQAQLVEGETIAPARS
jgi:LacI family transcriptional regulator